MRVIIYGIGAVGGTLAAALTLAGHSVVGIARGAQLEAIQKNGLRLRTPQQDRIARFDCVGNLSEIDLTPNDILLLCVKSQDTVLACQQIRKAGADGQPVFCTQNGIANEREALRYFSNVHGVAVMMPSMYLRPGEVAVFGEPNSGIFDIGRVPAGFDAADTALADLLTSANFAAFVSKDVMEVKRSKLLLNLANIVQAALGLGVDAGDLVSKLCAEAKAVYRARGLTWRDVSDPDPRRAELMRVVEVPGVERVGGSTLQSLLRDAGSIETDFLNGEIVLQGRLAGIETPLNVAMTRLGSKILRDGTAPGSMTLDDLKRFLGLPC